MTKGDFLLHPYAGFGVSSCCLLVRILSMHIAPEPDDLFIIYFPALTMGESTLPALRYHKSTTHDINRSSYCMATYLVMGMQ